MPVQIHGKEYKTVAERVSEFRASHEFSNYSIVTEIIKSDELCQIKASILNTEGRVIATGFAEEVRGSTNINKTSALENCETSAIGRALAAFGFGGTEYATANEVTDEIIQQNVMSATERYIAAGKAIRDNWDSIVYAKEQLGLDQVDIAKEALAEISDEDKQAFWIAPSKGGIFTTEERAKLKG